MRETARLSGPGLHIGILQHTANPVFRAGFTIARRPCNTG